MIDNLITELTILRERGATSIGAEHDIIWIEAVPVTKGEYEQLEEQLNFTYNDETECWVVYV